MNEKSLELNDLPVEMQQILVEKCDLISRCKLRAVSVKMNELVAATKLFIPAVRIKQLQNGGVFVKLTIKLFKDEYTLKFKKNEIDGTRICQSFRPDIVLEDSNPVNEAVAWFKTMCLQKNVSIGILTIDTSDKAESIVQKFEELLQKADCNLKIKSLRVEGSGAVDLMWKFVENCDVGELKELRIMTRGEAEPFQLFGKQDSVIKGLEKIEIDCESIITDEVDSLSASVLYLSSENATEDMIQRLIEKFMKKREDGSAFCIQNMKSMKFGDFLPPGFSDVSDPSCYYKEYENYLDNQPTIYLRVCPESVRLEVGRNNLLRFWTNNGEIALIQRPSDFDESDSDCDVYDHFEDIEGEFSMSPYDSEADLEDILNGSDFDSDYDYDGSDFEINHFY